MRITGSNPKRAGQWATITFADVGIREVVCMPFISNVKRGLQVKDNLELVMTHAQMLIKPTNNPMKDLFARCKVRVDVMRYANSLGLSYWERNKQSKP